MKQIKTTYSSVYKKGRKMGNCSKRYRKWSVFIEECILVIKEYNHSRLVDFKQTLKTKAFRTVMVWR